MESRVIGKGCIFVFVKTCHPSEPTGKKREVPNKGTVPSRELVHFLPGIQEKSSTQKCLGGGYFSSQEGIVWALPRHCNSEFSNVRLEGQNSETRYVTVNSEGP